VDGVEIWSDFSRSVNWAAESVELSCLLGSNLKSKTHVGGRCRVTFKEQGVVNKGKLVCL
jgi:hypothetical protein